MGMGSIAKQKSKTKIKHEKLNRRRDSRSQRLSTEYHLGKNVFRRTGFQVEENILYQDNQSAIKIEENGKRSSGQKTKHMDNRYFWIKDRLNNERIKVKYCPTERMVADFFTKPLQGNLFRLFRDVILGYKHISELDKMGEKLSSEERVRKDIPREADKRE